MKLTALNRGLFRSCVFLCALWVLFGTAIYLSDTGSDKAQSVAFGQFSEKKFESSQIARLPTRDELQLVLQSEYEREELPSWQLLWYRSTFGLTPILYEEPANDSNCTYRYARNLSNAVLEYPARCKTIWSFRGFAVFLLLPCLLIAILVAGVGWIIGGFRTS